MLPWWTDTEQHRRWPWDRRQVAEAALKRLIAKAREPSEPMSLAVLGESEAAATLLVLAAVEADKAAVVDLRERTASPALTAIRGRPAARYGERLQMPEAPTKGPDEPSLADRLRLLLMLPLDRLLPGPHGVLEWPAPILRFQLDGIRALLDRPRVLLADDMGLGKTIQALAAIRLLCLSRNIERVLVVAPAGLIDQWRREAQRWAPELRVMPIRGGPADRAWQWRADAHITLVGYETLRSDFTDNPASPPRRRVWDLVVIDEAQKIKNRDVEVSREVKQVGRRRSWALTGTPLENSEDDLASVLEFVDHTDDGSVRRFNPGPELRERHRELQIRRKKSEVLTELPPKVLIDVPLELSSGQRSAYDRAEQEGVVELRARGETVRIQHVLELITRLKQICNVDPATGQSAKLDDIEERIETLADEGHRSLVFSQYTDDTFGVEAIARRLERFAPLTYTGALTGSKRTSIIDEFKGDARHAALILSLRAGGVGLNLQEASYVFHFDRWWNPAAEHQAEDRVHRMGQLVPVTVYRYTCQETIEQRIGEILARKQQLFDELVDDVSVDLGSRMTAEELFGLFGMSPSSAGSTPKERVHPSGLELEDRCAEILKRRGWAVRRTPVTRDGGIDLIATRIDEVGIERDIYVQCKDHARPVGVEVVRELIGVLPANKPSQGVLASPAGVTGDAAALARARGISIWDAAALDRFESES